MLISYNADLLPKVRMLGQIRYNEPWIHFSRCINDWVLYVIRDGNLYLQENGIRYHLTAGDYFLLEPGLTHEGYQRASCDYYYAHFTHPDMCRAGDDRQAIAELAEKRRESLVGYNLESIDPTSPTTYLPKQFHLAGGEFKAQLRAAVECYDSREEDYKRRTSALLHSFLLQTAHEHLLSQNSAKGKKLRKSDVAAEQLLRYLNQNYTKHLTSTHGLSRRGKAGRIPTATTTSGATEKTAVSRTTGRPFSRPPHGATTSRVSSGICIYSARSSRI